MKNLKALMNQFKDDKYKFFYVDTQTGQVIRMTKTLTDGIVKEYDDLVKLNTENETRTYILKEYVDPCNIDDDIKKWFERYEDDYYQMHTYYTNLYDILSNIREYYVDYKKFNNTYDCVTHKVHVRVHMRDEVGYLIIRFEKEIIEDEDC